MRRRLSCMDDIRPAGVSPVWAEWWGPACSFGHFGFVFRLSCDGGHSRRRTHLCSSGGTNKVQSRCVQRETVHVPRRGEDVIPGSPMNPIPLPVQSPVFHVFQLSFRGVCSRRAERFADRGEAAKTNKMEQRRLPDELVSVYGFLMLHWNWTMQRPQFSVVSDAGQTFPPPSERLWFRSNSLVCF